MGLFIDSLIFRFKDVIIILDCTEVFIEKPSSALAKKHIWSEYKHHETCKFLIGFGPHMGLTYVSKMYGGRASDRHITRESRDLINHMRYLFLLFDYPLFINILLFQEDQCHTITIDKILFS